jgi:hypothetical protein
LAICFLQEFQRMSMFANANVCFTQHKDKFEATALLTFMTNLGPILFTNINSIAIHSSSILSLFTNNEQHSQLAMPMLASARVLKT